MALHLSTPVTALSGIGGLAEKGLRALGIVSVRDLLAYLPFRYEDYSVTKPIASLRHDDTVTVTARIRTIESRPSKKRNWEYYFFVDVKGHQSEAQVQQALKE